MERENEDEREKVAGVEKGNRNGKAKIIEKANKKGKDNWNGKR